MALRLLQVMAGADRGGAETAFVDLCRAFQSRGVTQHVVTRANDLRVPMLRDAGVSVTTLPFGGVFDLYTPLRLKRIIDQFKPDIVQTWMSRATAKTPPSNKKTYLNVARLGGYYNLKYYKHADYFVTNTPLIRDYLVDHAVRPDHVRHINNFAETEIVTHKINRADLNTPDDAFVCLALARYHPVKALDVLIKAVKSLPRVHVWLAGEGDERAALEQLTRDLSLQDRVHFLGWRSDRAALLDAADVCVCPSRSEPFGTVFVQGWAQKRPVIASMSDGPRTYIHSGVDGILFPIDDVDALTRAIDELQQSSSLCAALSAAAYERYKNEFTVDRCVDQYLSYYDEILRRESIIR